MNKYIDADHLNVELEKHIKEIKDAAERFTPNMGFFYAKLSGIYDVMALIDSLQHEQPEVDLEEEVKRYYSDNFAYISSDQPTLSILTNIARHFAEWGAEHLKR